MRFADIEGHAAVIERLQRAIARDRLPHTYLFAGPDGIGKYTTARSLAARLLCEIPGADSCGTCAGCLGAQHETHPDLVVTRTGEGASEIKIDQVRDLQRRLRLRPIRTTRKVAVIDEAHRMNLAAQNAMLKTFEEPPGSVLLILVASNAATLLPTVLSRCQRINFFPLPSDVVERLLRDRCDVGADQARELACYAEGSVGEALLLRTELIDRARTQLLPLLTDIARRPYADLAELAQDWGRVRTADLLLLLRAPLAWYRQQLADTVAAKPAVDVSRAALSQLRIVYDTIERLRRNAHRQLALDAMLLDLQRAARLPEHHHEDVR
jgi:DNA polymerase-3 subunit delta'